jgi:GNAT superfamily N-acetyltransferase
MEWPPEIVILGRPSPQLSAFTFPRYQKLLSLLPRPDLLVMAMVHRHGKTLGLLVSKVENLRELVLLSIYIPPSHRHLGYAQQLLKVMEHRARAVGILTLKTSYSDLEPHGGAMASLLLKMNWVGASQHHRHIVLKSEPEGLEPKVVQSYFRRFADLPLKTPLKWKSWNELTKKDEAFILEHLGQKGWPPVMASPLQKDSFPIAHDHSGLIFDDGDKHRNPVGWILAHQLNQNTVRFTHLHIIEPYNSSGTLMKMCIFIYVRSAKASEKTCFSMGIDVDNHALLSILEKLTRPFWKTHRFHFQQHKPLLAEDDS